MKNKKQPKEKTNPHPSSQKMKTFAAQFSKKDWSDLCFDPDFVRAMSTDLEKAAQIAKKLLNK